MSETKMLTCDTCGGIGEDDVDGWLTVYGTPNGTAYDSAHFCSCACLAEWATSLALEDDAYPPCLSLDARDAVDELAAQFALPAFVKPKTPTRRAAAPRRRPPGVSA
jgi:hypothetical protein